MGDALFEIDPDIRVARTLPARMYSDPEIFRLQRDRLFARTWHYAGHDDLVKVAGQVHPFTLLPGAVDEPLLLTRDQSDQVHCISNVCTHRGTLVVEGPGHEQQLRCRDHGRRFTLDGRFQSMPEFEQTANFPSPSDDLPRVSLGTWTRFHMVSLAPAMPFADLVSTPLAVHRTRVSFLPFVWDPNKRETGAGAGLDRVEREDEAVVESVQRGVRSRPYDRGRYSPAREGGVHHFHRLLAEFLTA